MSGVNITWHWPTHVRRWWSQVGPCDRYWCKFDRDYYRSDARVGDVRRCHMHGRLLVLTDRSHKPDSNGGTYYLHFKCLHPWRLGYWRARRMLPAPDARSDEKGDK